MRCGSVPRTSDHGVESPATVTARSLAFLARPGILAPMQNTARARFFRPALLEAMRDYSRADFARDLGAGLTVGLIALPLAIGFGLWRAGTGHDDGPGAALFRRRRQARNGAARLRRTADDRHLPHAPRPGDGRHGTARLRGRRGENATPRRDRAPHRSAAPSR